MSKEEKPSNKPKGKVRVASTNAPLNGSVDAPLKESVNAPTNSSKGKTVSSKLTADD